MGFEDLAKLKDMVKERIGDEFAQMTAMKLKRDVLDALDKEYTFELPEKLVDAEFKRHLERADGRDEPLRQDLRRRGHDGRGRPQGIPRHRRAPRAPWPGAGHHGREGGRVRSPSRSCRTR